MDRADELFLCIGSFLAGYGARDLVANLRALIKKRQEAKDNRGDDT